MSAPPTPSRDDPVTMATEHGPATVPCAACGSPFHPVGRARFCSPACRTRAWRRRHPSPTPPAEPPAARRRAAAVYECDCGTRQLGQQRCVDCGLFARRIGWGGICPHCEEPVSVEELLGGS